MTYRGEIDGLRALAVVPVVLFHAGFGAFGGGFVGVDIFFVISGYLITSIILKDITRGSFSLISFYERRARRILPALFLVTAVCAVAAWFFFMPRDLKDFAQSLFAVSTFSSNILFWRESGYFSTAAELKPLLHTWSLAVEEQFYIFFPLLLMGLWRFGKGAVLVCLAVLCVLSLGWAQWGAYHSPSATFYLLHTRAWELLLGAFAAFYLQDRDVRALPQPLLQWGSLLGLCMATLPIFVFDADTPFPSLYALIPTLGVVLIILCAHPGTFVQRMLAHKTLIGIGLISYSAYLWHHPLFAFARYTSTETVPQIMMLGLGLLAFGLAYFSWRYVEQPFRTRGRMDRRQVFAFSAAGLGLCAVLGLGGHVLQGVPQRLDPVQRALIESAQSSPLRANCHIGESDFRLPEAACAYFSPTQTWATFGDSHTVELAYGLAQLLRARQDGVRHFSFSNCPPRYGTSRTDSCTRWTHLAVADILASEALQNVVVSYRIALATHGDHHGVYPALPDDVTPQARAESWQAYVETLKAFVQAGKTVYLVLQAPEVRVDVKRLIRQVEPDADVAQIEGVPRSWWEARMAFVRQNLSDIPPEIIVIDPAQLFCDRISCAAIKDGQALYFDDDHISLAGARLIAVNILARAGPK